MLVAASHYLRDIPCKNCIVKFMPEVLSVPLFFVTRCSIGELMFFFKIHTEFILTVNVTG